MVHEKKPAMSLHEHLRQRFLWRLAATLFAACVLAVDNDALAAITDFDGNSRDLAAIFYEGEPYPAANPDVDSDGDIDPMDMAIVAQQLGTCDGDALYNPVADFDGDGCITDRDVSVITDLVPILVDVDRDGDGDIIDVMTMDAQLGMCVGNPDYNGAADLNGDGCVTELDLGLISAPITDPIAINTPLPLQ